MTNHDLQTLLAIDRTTLPPDGGPLYNRLIFSPPEEVARRCRGGLGAGEEDRRVEIPLERAPRHDAPVQRREVLERVRDLLVGGAGDVLVLALDRDRLLVGRPVLLQVERVPVPCRQTVLQVSGLTGDGLQGVDFEVRQGEILGLVGVAGNGQKPLVEIICGLRRPSTGSVRILGEEWVAFFARRDREKGLSYVPEDRQGLATCPGLDLLDNFLLTTRAGFCRGPWLRRGRAAGAGRVTMLGCFPDRQLAASLAKWLAATSVARSAPASRCFSNG